MLLFISEISLSEHIKLAHVNTPSFIMFSHFKKTFSITNLLISLTRDDGTGK